MSSEGLSKSLVLGLLGFTRDFWNSCLEVVLQSSELLHPKPHTSEV